MYEMLYDYEDDFKKIFKVRVEFDEEMKWSEEVACQYGGRLRKLRDENFCPLTVRPWPRFWSTAFALPDAGERSPRVFSTSPIWRANRRYAAKLGCEPSSPPSTFAARWTQRSTGTICSKLKSAN